MNSNYYRDGITHLPFEYSQSKSDQKSRAQSLTKISVFDVKNNFNSIASNNLKIYQHCISKCPQNKMAYLHFDYFHSRSGAIGGNQMLGRFWVKISIFGKENLL